LAFIGGKTNRHILNKKPNVYFEKEVIEKRGEEALSSQLIPLEKSMWEIEAYLDFLAWRRNAIAEEINKFMKKFE
jgi:hypothetical protein